MTTLLVAVASAEIRLAVPGIPLLAQEENAQGVIVDGVVERIADSDDYGCKLDLGRLPSGARVGAVVVLELRGDSTIHLSPNITLCNCVDFKMSDTRLSAEKKLVCAFLFSTPSFSRENRVRLPVRIEPGIVPEGAAERSVAAAIHLDIVYQLEGLMNFRELSQDVEVPDGAAVVEADLPLVVTPPVRVANLRVHLSDALRDVAARPLEAPDGAVVRVMCSSTVVSDGPVSGEIRVDDPETGRTSSARLTIKRTPRFLISPSLVRFSKPDLATGQGDGAERRWKAKLVLGIRQLPAPGGDPVPPGAHSPDQQGGLPVTFRIGETEIVCMATPVGRSRSHFRISLELPEIAVEELRGRQSVDKPSTLQVSFLLDGNLQSLELPFQFVD